MATNTIGTGQTFATITDWADAVKLIGTLTEDEIGVMAVDEVYPVAANSTALDFVSVILGAFTITLKADPAVKHNGDFGNGARIEQAVQFGGIFGNVRQVGLEDLSIHNTELIGNGARCMAGFSGVSGGAIRCIFRTDTSGASSPCVSSATSPMEACRFVGGTEGVVSTGGALSTPATYKNNTCIGQSVVGLSFTGPDVLAGEVQNNAVYDCAGTDFNVVDPDPVWTASNNASEDGTAPGTSPVLIVGDPFNPDGYTPFNGGQLDNAGVDLSITTDAAGRSFQNPPSIGAYENAKELTWNGVDSFGSFTSIGVAAAYILSFRVLFNTAPAVNNTLFGRSTTGANPWIFRNFAGELVVRNPSGISSVTTGGAIDQVDQLYYVVVNYDGVTLIVTVDGVEFFNGVASAEMDNLDMIAAHKDVPADFLSGVLQDVRIQNITAGTDFEWRIDSGSTVSEESILDANTLVFNNVVPSDWSGDAGVAEMTWTLRDGTGDYSSMQAWDDDLGTVDLTVEATRVFAHGGITGAIAPGAAVTGVSSGATGVVVGVVTAGQILIQSIVGTFQAEQIQVDASNHVTTSNTGQGAICTLECYNDWPAGLPETVIISGAITSVTNYLRIVAPVSERHLGVPGTGFYLKAPAAVNCLQINPSFTRLEYIEAWMGFATANTRYGMTIGPNCVATGCIARTISTNATAPAFLLNSGASFAEACLAVDSPRGFSRQVSGGGGNGEFYNCGAANCVSGFDFISGANVVVSNSWTFNCTTGWVDNGANLGASTNNASEDSTEVGANPITTDLVAGDFQDAANQEYKPTSISTLQAAGVDLSAIFTTDIVGDTYIAPWKAGPFATSATAPAVPLLSDPTGVATGLTTADGTVTTNASTGILYSLISVNAVETDAAVKAGDQQTVTAAGVKNVNATGLTSGTQYYYHYLHENSSGDSNQAVSAVFTTEFDIATLSNPSAVADGVVINVQVTTDTGGGDLYWLAQETAPELDPAVIIANGNTTPVTLPGVLQGNVVDLNQTTLYFISIVQVTSGNSNVVSTSATTGVLPIIRGGLHTQGCILAVTGGPTVNQGLAVWFNRQPNETLNDAAYRWLLEGGVAPASLNDMWIEYWLSEGIPKGSLNDMKHDYWCGDPGPRVGEVVTDSGVPVTNNGEEVTN